MQSTLLCSFLIVVAASCHAPARGFQVHPNSAWSLDPRVGAVQTATVATPDFLLIADTHASLLTAPHELSSNDYVVDGVVGAALRPPELDHWGRHVLEWLLRRSSAVKTVIHLGDAANISCTAEYAMFTRAMQESLATDQQWFYTPGNHDSLLMGNWAYTVNGEPLGPTSWTETGRATYSETRWGRECGAMPSMDKLDLVAAYRRAKHWTEGADLPQTDQRYVCQQIQVCDPKSQAPCDVDAVECKVAIKDDHQPGGCKGDDEHLCVYQAFLVQLLRLDHEWMLLLDTTDYREKPDPSRIGGVWGGISDKQVAIVESMLQRHEDLATRPVVIGSHYPIDALDKRSQIALQTIIEKTHALAYLSAHTHSPTAERYHGLRDQRTNQLRHDATFLELNVGSVAAWPMEYLYVSITLDAAAATGPPVATLTADVHSAGWALLGKDASVPAGDQCAAERRPDKDDYFFYDHYRRPKGYQKLVRAMFARERLALSQMNPPIKLPDDFELREIAHVPRGGSADDLSITHYERCQAVFASAVEGGSFDDLDGHGTAASSDPRTPERRCASSESASEAIGFPVDPPPASCLPRLLPAGQANATRSWYFVK